MEITATPEARSWIRERGGMLFVRLSSPASVRGAIRTLIVTTEPPDDALDYRRYETKFLLFLQPGVRPPRRLELAVVGWLRRRVAAFWNGCAWVV